jgi:hypothetical protein
MESRWAGGSLGVCLDSLLGNEESGANVRWRILNRTAQNVQQKRNKLMVLFCDLLDADENVAGLTVQSLTNCL